MGVEQQHGLLPGHAERALSRQPRPLPHADPASFRHDDHGNTIGTTNTSVPPKVSSAVSCEAEYKWDHPKRGQTQDHTRTVKLNSVTNPYNVVIGVAGAKNVTAGDYDLKVDIQ